MRILVVEDETRLAEELRVMFEQEGFDVDVCETAFEALDHAMSLAYDCIILDVMLPDGNGFSVVEDLREAHCHTPILMLTVQAETTDRVRGLNAGADDYLGKPFAPEELLARLYALVRRAPKLSDPGLMEVSDAILHTNTRTLEVGSRILELTSKEFLLLEFFFRHPNQVLTRDQLIAHVWGPDAEVADSALDTYIYFLRRKTQKIGWKGAISTVRGQGYRLATEGK